MAFWDRFMGKGAPTAANPLQLRTEWALEHHQRQSQWVAYLEAIEAALVERIARQSGTDDAGPAQDPTPSRDVWQEIAEGLDFPAN